jgi:hypothetical protein
MAVKQKTGPTAKMFFTDAIRLLLESRIPFMVGGGYAMKRHTGIGRAPRDLDVFMTPEDGRRALKHFEGLGYRTEVTFPHWLGKIHQGRAYVDVIWSSGNGIANVDPSWFEYALEEDVLGQHVFLCPPEEMIWSKAFIMERERFDGADVCHLLRACGRGLEWERLIARFGTHWPVLLAHVLLFQYAYPGEGDTIPRRVVRRLLDRAAAPTPTVNGGAARTDVATGEHICCGTCLSREYMHDVRHWGYRDARVRPLGRMTADEVARWMAAFEHE